MSIDLRSKSGGGVFVPTDLSVGLNIPAASSGELFQITPPAGKRVKLNILMCSGTGNTGVSVLNNGVKIIDEQVLKGGDSTAGTNSFCIGVQSVSETQVPSEINGAHPAITFGVDEVVTAEANTPTNNITYYNYEFGVIK